MLGTSDDIPINVTVENRGESAYETQLFVSHSASVPYNRIETEVSWVEASGKYVNKLVAGFLSTCCNTFEAQEMKNNETVLLSFLTENLVTC